MRGGADKHTRGGKSELAQKEKRLDVHKRTKTPLTKTWNFH